LLILKFFENIENRPLHIHQLSLKVGFLGRYEISMYQYISLEIYGDVLR